jgi:hypothetical protein
MVCITYFLRLLFPLLFHIGIFLCNRPFLLIVHDITEITTHYTVSQLTLKFGSIFQTLRKLKGPF